MRSIQTAASLLVALVALAFAPTGAAAHHTDLGRLPSLSQGVSGKLAPPAFRTRNTAGNYTPSSHGGPVNPIPEPTAILVFGAGLLVAGVALHRRRNR
jgi:hypothetical protein